jgi:hypothetical protein
MHGPISGYDTKRPRHVDAVNPSAHARVYLAVSEVGTGQKAEASADLEGVTCGRHFTWEDPA